MFAIAFPTVFYLLYAGILSGAAADADAPIAGTQRRTLFHDFRGHVRGDRGRPRRCHRHRPGTEHWLDAAAPRHAAPVRRYLTGMLAVSYVVTVPAIAVVLLAGVAVNQVEPD
jgi:hypothetical protein